MIQLAVAITTITAKLVAIEAEKQSHLSVSTITASKESITCSISRLYNSQMLKNKAASEVNNVHI